MRRAQQVQEHLDRRERHRAVMHQRMRTHALVMAMRMMMVIVVVVVTVTMIMVMIMDGLFTKPAAHVGALGFGVVEAAVEQQGRLRAGIVGVEHDRARVDLPQPCPQSLDIPVFGEVGLGENDAIGHRRLHRPA